MLSCVQVAFSWPDGQVVVHAWTYSLNNKKWGIIGRNGAGKTTLLRLLLGELEPTRGRIDRSGQVLSVSQFFLQGQEIGLRSGGEMQMKRLSTAFQQRPDLLGLDEPTHHLDEGHRHDLTQLIQRFRGTLLMISHDVDFLRQMDGIVWIESGEVRVFPQGYDSFVAWRNQDRQEREFELANARESFQLTQNQRVQSLERQRQRMRQGRRLALKGGMPRILIGGLKRQAEKSFAKLQSKTRGRVTQAEDRFAQAIENRNISHRPWFEIKDAEGNAKAKKETGLLLSLQDVQAVGPEGTPLWEPPISLQIRGSDRLWLRGENGVGKSSLLQWIFAHAMAHAEGQTANMPSWVQWRGQILGSRCRVGYFRQGEFPSSEDRTSTFSCLRQVSQKSDQEILDQLARFQIPLQMARRPRRELSGGEWMRSRFAEFLLADQPVDLLILDEPSHHLDLETREWLIEVLNQYPHAILFTSHEQDFGTAIKANLSLQLQKVRSRVK